MKSVFPLFIIIFLFFSFSGCKDPKTGIVIPETVEKYPTALNTEWEYETMGYIAVYDTNGNLGEDSIAFPGIFSIVKIVSTKDSLFGVKDLIRFDYYQKDIPNKINTEWYINNDTIFQKFAFHNSFATSWVTPKKTNSTIQIFRDHLTKQLFPDIGIASTDTEIVYASRIVMNYPIIVGQKWESVIPFLGRKYKTVVEKSQLTVLNGYYPCYIIKETDNPTSDRSATYDYINFEIGLLQRKSVYDSIEITTTENPYGSGKFVRIKSTSTLIRKSN